MAPKCCGGVGASSHEAMRRDAGVAGNPVGGYYWLRKGYRGRFANHLALVMEVLGMEELEHNARNSRVRFQRQ